jgi:hypothetical protein
MVQKFYHKYKDALEAKGYRVDEHGYVWDGRGNQAAGEDNYGNVQSKDPNVTQICQEAEMAMTKTPKPRAKKAKKKEETEVVENLEMVRARDENGHFIADDPSTPDVNEAWVVKTVKKVVKKK